MGSLLPSAVRHLRLDGKLGSVHSLFFATCAAPRFLPCHVRKPCGHSEGIRTTDWIPPASPHLESRLSAVSSHAQQPRRNLVRSPDVSPTKAPLRCLDLSRDVFLSIRLESR